MLQQRFQTGHQEGPAFEKDLSICLSILGLEALPDPGQLRQAYKALIKQWHPDRFFGREELAELALRKTQRINLAYRYLLELVRPGKTEPEQRTAGQHSRRHNYCWQTYSDGFPDPSIDEFFLNSSHIVSAGYNSRRKILYLKFLGDEIYLYFDVPEFIFEHLLQAHSPGKYALKFVYDRFRHRKFTPITRNFRSNS